MRHGPINDSPFTVSPSGLTTADEVAPSAARPRYRRAVRPSPLRLQYHAAVRKLTHPPRPAALHMEPRSTTGRFAWVSLFYLLGDNYIDIYRHLSIAV